MLNKDGCMNMMAIRILDLKDGWNTVLPCFRNSESSSLMASNLSPKAQLPITSVEYEAITSRVSIRSLDSLMFFLILESSATEHSFTCSFMCFSLLAVNVGLSFWRIVLHRSPPVKNILLFSGLDSMPAYRPRSVKLLKSLISI